MIHCVRSHVQSRRDSLVEDNKIFVVNKLIQNSSSLVSISRAPRIVVSVKVDHYQSARGKRFQKFEISRSQVAVRGNVHIDNVYAADIDSHAFDKSAR